MFGCLCLPGKTGKSETMSSETGTTAKGKILTEGQTNVYRFVEHLLTDLLIGGQKCQSTTISLRVQSDTDNLSYAMD